MNNTSSTEHAKDHRLHNHMALKKIFLIKSHPLGKNVKRKNFVNLGKCPKAIKGKYDIKIDLFIFF